MGPSYISNKLLKALNISSGGSLDSARSAGSEQFVGRVCLGRSGILLQVMIAKNLLVIVKMVDSLNQSQVLMMPP